MTKINQREWGIWHPALSPNHNSVSTSLILRYTYAWRVCWPQRNARRSNANGLGIITPSDLCSGMQPFRRPRCGSESRHPLRPTACSDILRRAEREWIQFRSAIVVIWEVKIFFLQRKSLQILHICTYFTCICNLFFSYINSWLPIDEYIDPLQ